jgi:hypothetical protein
MSGHFPNGMEGARLRLLVLDRNVAQDRRERFCFMMRLFQGAPARQWGQRPRDFFSGHRFESSGLLTGQRSGFALFLTVPIRFVQWRPPVQSRQ